MKSGSQNAPGNTGDCRKSFRSGRLEFALGVQPHEVGCGAQHADAHEQGERNHRAGSVNHEERHRAGHAEKQSVVVTEQKCHNGAGGEHGQAATARRVDIGPEQPQTEGKQKDFRILIETRAHGRGEQRCEQTERHRSRHRSGQHVHERHAERDQPGSQDELAQERRTDPLSEH